MTTSRLLSLTPLSLAMVLCTGCPSGPDDGFVRAAPLPGVRGTICAPNGINEVQRAQVSLYADADEDGEPDNFNPLATSMTNFDGGYLLEDIGGGTYVAEVRKGHRLFQFPVVSSGGIQQRLERQCFPGDSAAVAVISGGCDNPAGLLTSLGYTSQSLSSEELGLLTNPAQLAAWDIVIAPCGMPMDWLPQAETVTETLGDWLDTGGSLYVSGDAWPLIETLDPDLLEWVGDDEDPTAANVGYGSTVEATVMDQELAGVLGGPAQIVLPESWSMIEQAGLEWNLLVMATVQTTDGVFLQSSPLAVSRRGPQRGTLTYSSFGNSGATPDMTLLLDHWLTEL